MKNKENILIIGANGKTGSIVLKKLLDRGYNAVGASRSSEIKFDWDDISTWKTALSNMDKIYVTYYPDLAVSKAPEDIEKLCLVAKESGVRHITLLSGRGEEAAQQCENILINSGVTWSVVRASWFNQNFTEGLFNGFVKSGYVSLPVADMTEPFIDTNDIAEVVVSTLVGDGHDNKLYEVTGPDLLTFAEIVEIINQETGKDIKFQTNTIDEFRLNLEIHNVPSGAIEMLTYLFSEVLDGRNNFTTNTIMDVLGRKATSFREFVKLNVNNF